MSKFLLTSRARLDLQFIWNRIAEDDIDAADKEAIQITFTPVEPNFVCRMWIPCRVDLIL
jgi:hypothetical protein